MLNGYVFPEFPWLLLYKPLGDEIAAYSISKILLLADYRQDFSGKRAALVTDGKD